MKNIRDVTNNNSLQNLYSLMNHKEKILSNSFDPNKDKERFKRKRFEIRKRLDILDFRRRKLKELYDEENEELKFELMSKSQKRNSNAPIESCQKEPILTNNNSSPNVKTPVDKLKLQCNKINFPDYNEKHSNKPQLALDFDVTSELDKAIRKQNENLNKLKLDDFMTRKKLQDDLLNKINMRLNKIKNEINDKAYQEKLAHEWYMSRLKQNQNI